MGSRDVGEERQNLFNRKVERYHCTGVASRDAFFYEVVLRQEFLLHRSPDHLQQVFFVAQVLFDFLVEIFEAFLHLSGRILRDDLSKLLLGERHLVADLGLFDALRHFDLHAFEELLKTRKFC